MHVPGIFRHQVEQEIRNITTQEIPTVVLSIAISIITSMQLCL